MRVMVSRAVLVGLPFWALSVPTGVRSAVTRGWGQVAWPGGC